MPNTRKPYPPEFRRGHVRSSAAIRQVERQQFGERVVVGDVGRPAVGGGNGSVEGRVRVGEPCRASVVKARQCACLERGCGGLVARHRTCRIAGNRLVQPLDPFGRVEPPVAQLDQPLSCVRDGSGARVVCIVGGGGVRRQPVGERKRLEGAGWTLSWSPSFFSASS